MISDTEAFRRPLGGYYRDRFSSLPARPDQLRVLFVTPYPICPPVHGGGVFMEQTCRYLAPLVDLHLVVNLDDTDSAADHAELAAQCASVEYLPRVDAPPRQPGSITPHAVREFANDDLAWIIHRKLYLDEIDVLQLEYTPMAQYAGDYRQLVSILFEHDVYFQSIARTLATGGNPLGNVIPTVEYMRALRYELRTLPRLDRIQVCTRENADYLTGYLPKLRDRIDSDLRAGIDVGRYPLEPGHREPLTMLFLGGFRHVPNLTALRWFLEHVLPLVLAEEPSARLIVVGSDPPLRHSLPDPGPALELRGRVEDVREPLSRYEVFICPILSGSGVRVKLLEAFSAGIPVVSTPLGAEGLTDQDGDVCALAGDPATFAAKVVHLFRNPAEREALAHRARTGSRGDAGYGQDDSEVGGELSRGGRGEAREIAVNSQRSGSEPSTARVADNIAVNRL